MFASVLAAPNTTRPFIIEMDASKWATGVVLIQKDALDELHPCAFLSQAFSPAKRNYEIDDCKLLAIIRALKEWRHYLLGSSQPVLI